jgi:hypothetical protein
MNQGLLVYSDGFKKRVIIKMKIHLPRRPGFSSTESTLDEGSNVKFQVAEILRLEDQGVN